MAYDANVPADSLLIASIPEAIRNKGVDVKALIDEHVADTTSAHTASSIANIPAGGIAATDVQTALNELDTEKAPKASPTFTGTVAGITGTMITNTPAGNIIATNVQTALNELDTEKVAHSLVTAENDFLVASASATIVKKTLAETKGILGITNVTNDAQVKKIASATDNQVARWDGITGALIQGSLMTIDDSGSPDIPNTQTYKINGTSLNASHVSAVPSSYLDTDVALTANSDTKVPSQKATKAYVDGKSGKYGQVEWLTPGTYSWTVPAGITKAEIEIGAGGGGGSRGGTNEAGAGGGCGEYKVPTVFTVTPGGTHTVVVGAAGAGSSSVSSDGTAGGNSSVGSLVSCTGGAGGQREDAGGTPAGGTAGGGVFAKNGASAFSMYDKEVIVWYAGCGGDLLPASGRYGVGGGKLSGTVYLGENYLQTTLTGGASSYRPNIAGHNASGFCAGGGGGNKTYTAHSGGNGAPGFVKIKYWSE